MSRESFEKQSAGADNQDTHNDNVIFFERHRDAGPKEVDPKEAGRMLAELVSWLGEMDVSREHLYSLVQKESKHNGGVSREFTNNDKQRSVMRLKEFLEKREKITAEGIEIFVEYSTVRDWFHRQAKKEERRIENEATVRNHKNEIIFGLKEVIAYLGNLPHTPVEDGILEHKEHLVRSVGSESTEEEYMRRLSIEWKHLFSLESEERDDRIKSIRLDELPEYEDLLAFLQEYNGEEDESTKGDRSFG